MSQTALISSVPFYSVQTLSLWSSRGCCGHCLCSEAGVSRADLRLHANGSSSHAPEANGPFLWLRCVSGRISVYCERQTEPRVVLITGREGGRGMFRLLGVRLHLRFSKCSSCTHLCTSSWLLQAVLVWSAVWKVYNYYCFHRGSNTSRLTCFSDNL